MPPYPQPQGQRGDGAVREVLVQAALTLLTRVHQWSALKAWGMAVAKRRGLRRAIVAVARKLAIIMHRMWADTTTFNWSTADCRLGIGS
jgi:hypothetical protein